MQWRGLFPFWVVIIQGECYHFSCFYNLVIYFLRAFVKCDNLVVAVTSFGSFAYNLFPLTRKLSWYSFLVDFGLFSMFFCLVGYLWFLASDALLWSVDMVSANFIGSAPNFFLCHSLHSSSSISWLIVSISRVLYFSSTGLLLRPIMCMHL